MFKQEVQKNEDNYMTTLEKSTHFLQLLSIIFETTGNPRLENTLGRDPYLKTIANGYD